MITAGRNATVDRQDRASNPRALAANALRRAHHLAYASVGAGSLYIAWRAAGRHRRFHLDGAAGAAIPRDLGAAERNPRGGDRRRRVHAHALRRCERDPGRPRACRVVEVSPLLREVIAALDDAALTRQRKQDAKARADARHARARRNHPLAAVALSVPMPTEKRLRALCHAGLTDPSNSDLNDGHRKPARPRVVRGLFGGADGTRTRDPRRDRPVF